MAKPNPIFLEDYGILWPKNSIVSIVGAGGKTTLLFWLANQFKQKGCRVLCTTTTHMQYPQFSQYDKLVIEKDPNRRSDLLTPSPLGTITYCASHQDSVNQK